MLILYCVDTVLSSPSRLHHACQRPMWIRHPAISGFGPDQASRPLSLRSAFDTNSVSSPISTYRLWQLFADVKWRLCQIGSKLVRQTWSDRWTYYIQEALQQLQLHPLDIRLQTIRQYQRLLIAVDWQLEEETQTGSSMTLMDRGSRAKHRTSRPTRSPSKIERAAADQNGETVQSVGLQEFVYHSGNLTGFVVPTEARRKYYQALLFPKHWSVRHSCWMRWGRKALLVIHHEVSHQKASGEQLQDVWTRCKSSHDGSAYCWPCRDSFKVTNGAFTSRIRCHHNDYAHKRNLGTQTSPSNKTKLSLIAFLLPHPSIRLEMLLDDSESRP